MSFLLGLLPYVGSFTATVGAEVAGATGIVALGTATEAVVGAGIGAFADAALSRVIDTESLKKEGLKQLSFAQKIALIKNKTNGKEIISIIKGTDELKDTNLDNIKDRSKLFVNEVSEELLKGQLLDQAVESVSDGNNLYNWLGLSILSKEDIGIVPKDPEYVYVSSIYNGSVFFAGTTNERITGGNREFYTETERGTISWFYPDYNTYRVIPPIWGVWTGINSPNNNLPISMEIDGSMRMSLLDRIAHVHDVLYREYGTFNKFADYVLISYIQHGLKQGLFVLPGEKQRALLAINYFSSLGKVMRALYGGSNSIYDLGTVVDGEPVEDPQDDTSTSESVPLLAELATDLDLDPTELITAEVVSDVRNNIGTNSINELIGLINGLSFETD